MPLKKLILKREGTAGLTGSVGKAVTGSWGSRFKPRTWCRDYLSKEINKLKNEREREREKQQAVASIKSR